MTETAPKLNPAMFDMNIEKGNQILVALGKVMKSITGISKNNRSTGQFSFAYRGIDDVMNELHDLFAENDVLIMPNLIEHTMEKQTNAKGRTQYHHFATFKFAFIASDGSFLISGNAKGECLESGDKGLGKCQSYALKNLLLQMFLIPTDDKSRDPDAFTPQLGTTQNVTNQRNNQGNGNRGNQQRNGSNRGQGNRQQNANNGQNNRGADRGNQQPQGQGFNGQKVNGGQLSALINLASQVNVSQEQMEQKAGKPMDQWNANEYQKMKQGITSMLAGMNNNQQGNK